MTQKNYKKTKLQEDKDGSATPSIPTQQEPSRRTRRMTRPKDGRRELRQNQSQIEKDLNVGEDKEEEYHKKSITTRQWRNGKKKIHTKQMHHQHTVMRHV